ncbi:hypothetical protein ACWCSU_50515, partial [Nonomuraea sp. NPDC001699]
ASSSSSQRSTIAFSSAREATSGTGTKWLRRNPHLLDYLGGVLVIPQTVLIEKYWTEIRTGLDKAGIPLRHFLLHTDSDTLAHRIETDLTEAGARQWRLEHLPQYQKALPWLRREAQVVDTSAVLPKQVAEVIATKAGIGDVRTRSDS